MPWDSDKSTAADPDNPTADEQLTADEWDNHVIDQKNRGYNSLTTVTANHTASTQEIVLADASGGALTVTLPSPEASTSVMVKKADSSSNAVTISTPNTETIDGDSSRSITGENVTREIVSDGSNYFVLYSVLDSSDSGVVDADVNNSSTDTGNLDIGGGKLVSTGDFVGRKSFSTYGSETFSTTSTSYVSSGDQAPWFLIWSTYIPSDVQGAVVFAYQVNPGTDETVDIRLQNVGDSETIIEDTGYTSAQDVESGPTNYTPTTTSSTFYMKPEIKTSSGANASELKRPSAVIGVQV